MLQFPCERRMHCPIWNTIHFLYVYRWGEVNCWRQWRGQRSGDAGLKLNKHMKYTVTVSLTRAHKNKIKEQILRSEMNSELKWGGTEKHNFKPRLNGLGARDESCFRSSLHLKVFFFISDTLRSKRGFNNTSSYFPRICSLTEISQIEQLAASK